MTEAAPSSPVLQAEDVHYAYQGRPALGGLTLSCQAGERIVLLGANGSGKSTLLKLLDALVFPAQGSVSAFGQQLTEHAMQDEATAIAFRRRVGLVFQNPDIQLFCPTVFDELAFGPLQLGWPRATIRDRIGEMLERFSMAHIKDRAPHRLSGGEKKRVALASVLIIEPEVLLLDEPTAALDPESTATVIDLLARSRGSGRTIVTATHDLDIVEGISDRCFVLSGGQVAASGTPREILSDGDLLGRHGLAHAHFHAHGGAAAHRHHHLHRGGIWHDDA